MTWEDWRRDAIAKLPPPTPFAKFKSVWREQAAIAVERALEGVPYDTERAALRRILRVAYPFGERRMWPYKCWLEEVKYALRLRGME